MQLKTLICFMGACCVGLLALNAGGIQGDELVPFQTLHSAKGMPVLWLENIKMSTIKLHIGFKNAGLDNDIREKNGLLSFLLVKILQEKANPQSNTPFSKLLQSLEVRVKFFDPVLNNRYFNIWLEGSPKAAGIILKALYQQIKHVTRHPKQFNTLLQQHKVDLGNFLQKFNNPAGLRSLGKMLIYRLLCAESPLSPADYLTELLNITDALWLKMLKSYIKTHLVRDNIVISGVGNMASSDLLALLDNSIGMLPSKSIKLPRHKKPIQKAYKYYSFQDIPESIVCFGKIWDPAQPAYLKKSVAAILSALINRQLKEGVVEITVK
jgi:hypothetical protein